MGTLVCTITLDKESGAKVVIENADAKITQTLAMDGTAITITVAGNDATSTITQKQDSIAINCKTFTLDAETITCKSSKATLHESSDTFTAKSTKDMKFETQANLTHQATQDAKLSAMKIEQSAQTDYKVSGMNIALAGQVGIKAEAVKLEVTGSAQVAIKGAMVEVKADGILNAEAGGVATVKGAMTNIQGNLVKLG